MNSIKRSIATRLALGYGLLVATSVMIVSAIFYFGTIGVLNRSIDGKIATISERLVEAYQGRPVAELTREIERQLTDGIDSDSEIFLVVSPAGRRVTGNLSSWPDATTPHGQLVSRPVVRDGKPSSARLIIRELADGGLLIVGRDLREQESIRDLVARALVAGAAFSLVLAIAGGLYFRRQIERRIGDIRRTAHEIEGGDLSRRIVVSGDDEFGRLNIDINRMLDRIEHLMEGVRHVSNAIAHDLRTPLSRVRSKLDEALQHELTITTLSDAAYAAIEGIDDLILVFEKLLQIAEAESGMRTKSFDLIDLNGVADDMVELYDASAEENRVTLKVSHESTALAVGDRNLLASAVASLIDNAIKYAGPSAIVEVGAYADVQTVSIVVRDNGPGIPAKELPRVTERFYRLDQSRSLPGNGLGLSIVSAIATLHGGKLYLSDAAPGLIARIELPSPQTAVVSSLSISRG
jgi:signal transduction histidine kinase